MLDCLGESGIARAHALFPAYGKASFREAASAAAMHNARLASHLVVDLNARPGDRGLGRIHNGTAECGGVRSLRREPDGHKAAEKDENYAKRHAEAPMFGQKKVWLR